MRAFETFFLDLNEVAFCSVEELENVFTMPGDHLKNRFLDLTQVAFLNGQ